MMESMRLQGGGTPVEETPAPVAAPVPSVADVQEKAIKLGRKSGGKGKEKEKVKEEVVGVKVEDEAVSKQSTPVSVPAIVMAAPIPGGPVEASRTTSNELDEILPRTADEWVWTRLVDKLEAMLESDAWEARHGSALALRDLVRIQGAGCGTVGTAPPTDNGRMHYIALGRLAKKLVLVLVSDRFGDFIGDSVMAPVRESAAQALASVVSRMPVTMVTRVGKTLLDMITQGWKAVPYVWELRHAGLLGLRYMLAVIKGQGVRGEEARGLGLHDVITATMIG
jgi:TATA-binding protein-associated factor